MVAKKIFETAVKLSKYDKKAWDSLYFGIRKDISEGIYTGFGLGTVIGGLIEDWQGSGNDASLPPDVQTPYRFNQKGRRRFGSSYSKYRKYNSRCKCYKRKRLVRRNQRRSSARMYY